MAGAEMPELTYSTRVSSNEPCSVMWLATMLLEMFLLSVGEITLKN